MPLLMWQKQGLRRSHSWTATAKVSEHAGRSDARRGGGRLSAQLVFKSPANKARLGLLSLPASLLRLLEDLAAVSRMPPTGFSLKSVYSAGAYSSNHPRRDVLFQLGCWEMQKNPFGMSEEGHLLRHAPEHRSLWIFCAQVKWMLFGNLPSSRA